MNWLPEPIAAALGRYAPAAEGAAAGGAWPATDDMAPAGDAVRTPTAPGEASAAAGKPTGRRPLLAGRRLAWLAAAVAVLAAASAATALGLTGGGTARPSAQPPAHPVAAATRATSAPAAVSSSPAPKPAARKTHQAHATRSPGTSGTSSGGQQASSPVSQPTTASAAASTGVVPDVLGEQLDPAVAALEARGFHNIPWEYECLGSNLILDVITQNPSAGASLALTAPVQLALQANNCATVPDVIGFDLANAETAFKDQGFTNYNWYYGCYGSSQIDDVVTESPGGGTSYGTDQLISIKLQADNCT